MFATCYRGGGEEQFIIHPLWGAVMKALLLDCAGNHAGLSTLIFFAEVFLQILIVTVPPPPPLLSKFSIFFLITKLHEELDNAWFHCNPPQSPAIIKSTGFTCMHEYKYIGLKTSIILVSLFESKMGEGGGGIEVRVCKLWDGGIWADSNLHIHA